MVQIATFKNEDKSQWYFLKVLVSMDMQKVTHKIIKIMRVFNLNVLTAYSIKCVIVWVMNVLVNFTVVIIS